MNNTLKHTQIPFTQIPNEMITSNELSAAAFRVYCYLRSKPNDWKFWNKEIMQSLNIKGERTLAKCFKQLIENGWIERKRQTDKKGKMTGGFQYKTVIKPYQTKKHIWINSTNGKKDGHTNINLNTNTKKKLNNIEKRREEPSPNQIEIINLWNLRAVGNIPKLNKMTKSRMSNYNKRVKEGLDLSKIFDAVAESDFLQGNNDKNWSITFDWIIANDKNWIKVMEGNYKNEKSKRPNKLPEWAEKLPDHTR